VRLQAPALAEQQELSKPNLFDGGRQIAACAVERGQCPADDLVRPVEIRGAVISGLERAK
jgi:hypothetical protein